MNRVAEWVNQAANDIDQRRFRQATHTLLMAIAAGVDVLPEMVMKGGVLLAIRYNTHRMTRDIDFSTQALYQDFAPTQESFLQNLDRLMANAADALPYGLQMRVQSKQVKPRAEGSFQTLSIKIGYAASGEPAALRRLVDGQSPNVLSVDYSFNEAIHDFSHIEDDALGIKTYGEFTLIAEKFRAYLQQIDRDRERGRDLYDLWCLLKDRLFSDEEKRYLLQVIQAKAASRSVAASITALHNPELMRRAQRAWPDLDQQVEQLPAFEQVFSTVAALWAALPWDTSHVAGNSER